MQIWFENYRLSLRYYTDYSPICEIRSFDTLGLNDILLLYLLLTYNMTKDEKIRSILQRGVEEIIHKKHLSERLSGRKKLRVKLGIDPTSPNIHIGRAVVLWKLRAFQELGHKVVLIIGDFTGLVGDTSDKDSERPMLTEKHIKENLKDYLKQAGKIID